MALKAIPNDLIAEQSVLGSMFLSKLAIEKANESLIKNSFYDEKNGIIFQCIIDLYDKKVPIDLTTVTAELNQQNKLVEILKAAYAAKRAYQKQIIATEELVKSQFIGEVA